MSSLAERDARVIWHPFTHLKHAPLPIALTRAEGVFLYDDSGNKYIDGISSWWVNAHGHSHPHIVKKISGQLQQMEHAMFAAFTHEPAVELAERLLKRLPQLSKVFYSDNGSTSVEVALKMAFQYWDNSGSPRKDVIAFKNGYHGDTFGGMSAGARNVFNRAFESFLFDVNHIDVPLKGREEASLEQLEEILRRGESACFIFEPLVQGAGGMVMYEAGILDKMMELCRQYGCITIADEVMTGFGRTGKFFATDFLENKPDIICLSKALTGGFMPLGATACKEYIYQAFITDDRSRTFFHGHSYTANPTACSAALASLDLFDEASTTESIERISEQHRVFAGKVAGHRNLVDARALGTIIAFEVRTKEETSYLNSLSESMADFFLQRGIVLRPLGNVLYILPPYCISEEQLNTVYSAVLEFLDSF